MRESTFAISYERGSDPLMDLFIERPDLVSVSMDACVCPDRFWRVEQFTGPREVLDEVERRRVVYSYVAGLDGCTSIHALAGRYLVPGCCSRRDGRAIATSGAS